MSGTRIPDVFWACADAMTRVVLMDRTKADKEFHFQRWFEARLTEAGIAFDNLGRNSYPDYVLPTTPEGYEVKGLAYPGREQSFDCNSQVPKGFHNERTVVYVFGRYPSWEDGRGAYPITDLILCHGDFLNARRSYIHKNSSIRGFGSYGDILVRDRKMYVAPTPFALTEGTAGNKTLILPAAMPVEDPRVELVGQLERVETDRLLTGYAFDLRTNTLTGDFVENPTKGTVHRFSAYRLKGAGGDPVFMRAARVELPEETNEAE